LELRIKEEKEMLIPTTVTQEQSFQVVDPITVTPPGSIPAQYSENGFTQIPIGTQTLFIAFQTVKAAPEYLFDELEIQNVVDSNPLVLAPEIGPHDATGFTVSFNGVPNTINYYVRWAVRVPT
jgi:hypothetical protein